MITTYSEFRIRNSVNNGSFTSRRSNSIARQPTEESGPKLSTIRDNEEEFHDRVTRRHAKDLARAQSLIKYRTTTKGERTYDLIFDKKSHNDIKYTEKSRINNNAVPIHKGTLSMMLSIRKRDSATISHFKDKVTSKAKFKIKWKTIQWLIESKREAIETLSSQYQVIIKIFKNKGAKDGMNREEFGELLIYLGLGAEKNLGDKLFFIFDDDGNGTIDYRELIMGLETFKDTAFKEKLQVFFDICDLDGSGYITRKELYDVLKRNCITEDERAKLKKTINIIFKEADLNCDGKLEKQELFPYAVKNQQLQTIVEENIRSIRRIDKIIENDLGEPFNNWVPTIGAGGNMREGVHFPLLRNFVAAIKQQEDIKFGNRVLKLEYLDKMKRLKALNGQEDDESGSDKEE